MFSLLLAKLDAGVARVFTWSLALFLAAIAVIMAGQAGLFLYKLWLLNKAMGDF